VIPEGEGWADPKLFREHIRDWSRRAVNVPTKVEILVGPKRFTSGSALIRNISFKGALLGKMILTKRVLPARTFRLRLTFSTPKYRGIGALCRPVRFGDGEKFELGVAFESLWVKA